MTTGRIIDGARFDAQLEAQTLLASARCQADEVVAQAQRKAEQILVDAALHAAVLRRDISASAPPGVASAATVRGEATDVADATRPADGDALHHPIDARVSAGFRSIATPSRSR